MLRSISYAFIYNPWNPFTGFEMQTSRLPLSQKVLPRPHSGCFCGVNAARTGTGSAVHTAMKTITWALLDKLSITSYLYVRVNPPLAGGRKTPPPLANFLNNLKTSAYINAKLTVPYTASIWHIHTKFQRNPSEFFFEKMAFEWRHIARFRVEKRPTSNGF